MCDGEDYSIGDIPVVWGCSDTDTCIAFPCKSSSDCSMLEGYFQCDQTAGQCMPTECNISGSGTDHCPANSNCNEYGFCEVHTSNNMFDGHWPLVIIINLILVVLAVIILTVLYKVYQKRKND